MAEQSFKIGDIVQLKSGGPKMTVVPSSPPIFTLNAEEAEEIKCQWFAGSNLKFGFFDPNALKSFEQL